MDTSDPATMLDRGWSALELLTDLKRPPASSVAPDSDREPAH